jgi:hypothetical protein
MRLSKTLHTLKERSAVSALTLQNVVTLLGEKGHALLMCIFTIPFLQPIPTLGLSAPFGLMISMIGFCMMLRIPPWVPKRFKRLTIKKDLLHSCSDTAEKIFLRIEHLIKPRLLFMHRSIFHRITGALILLNGILMALPLPIPGTNSLPAWTLLILGLSEIEEDGLMTLIGYALSAGCFIFFILLAWAALTGVSIFNTSF